MAGSAWADSGMRAWCPLCLLTGKGFSPVIDVRVDAGKLHVRLTGWDAFAVCWRLSWEWEVPVSKIVRVYVRPARPALPIRSRTRWGPCLPELRRVRSGLPSLWIDICAEKYQRLAVSSAGAEDLAGQIARAGVPVKIRHGEPGPLTPSDVSRLATGEFTRGG
jgi:hypothetical protein